MLQVGFSMKKRNLGSAKGKGKKVPVKKTPISGVAPRSKKQKTSSSGASGRKKAKTTTPEPPIEKLRLPSDDELSQLCERGVFDKAVQPSFKDRIEVMVPTQADEMACILRALVQSSRVTHAYNVAVSNVGGCIFGKCGCKYFIDKARGGSNFKGPRQGVV
jgi:hypothetical protein